MRLSELEADVQLDVPREIGHAIKRLAADPQYAAAWRFITEQLCGVRRLSFVPTRPEARDTMVWFEGRRFVGEQLLRIAETVITDTEPASPPARTMTEKARRRVSPQQEDE